MMKTYFYNQLAVSQLAKLTLRPAVEMEKFIEIVRPILEAVRKDGDTAVNDYCNKFDGCNFSVIEADEIEQGSKRVDAKTTEAFKLAYDNIYKFHKSQVMSEQVVETAPGVKCFRQSRPLDSVGLYVPGGTAPLPSTLLMLAIPAQIAGVEKVLVCTPPDKKTGKVPDIILFAANLCGIKRIYQVGGAQAIAAMAYGTESIERVNKIFGPGNPYVMAAKLMVSTESTGAAIDMPAGPSEVLVIADDNANAKFVAADLLSQAEHGPDSQVVLLTLSVSKAIEVKKEVAAQLKILPRQSIATEALENSFVLICGNIRQAFDFSNEYAPEHLIINCKNAAKYVAKVRNAGSVFLGQYSCESAGDYASGTNHTLATSAYAKSYSGVSVDSFVKKITFQQLSEEGVRNIGPSVEIMAKTEGLDAHANAMTMRLQATSKQKQTDI